MAAEREYMAEDLLHALDVLQRAGAHLQLQFSPMMQPKRAAAHFAARAILSNLRKQLQIEAETVILGAPLEPALPTVTLVEAATHG